LAVLGLVSHSGALTAAVLRDAFRKNALAWHPDRHPGPLKHTAEAKFKEAQAAYQLLKSLLVG
jgi:DnaJ-class molecular chaperone